MWYTDYIREIRRQLIDVYGFKPLPNSTKKEPLTEAPDGEYPMTIEGKRDHVRIVKGIIHCCRFRKSGKAKAGSNRK